MKTPEEIKKGLEYCHSSKPCIDCQYDKRDFPHCVRRLLKDAINGYRQLESRLDQVERERDALKHDFLNDPCLVCKHGPAALDDCKAPYTPCKFEWRGVCSENTKEE